MAESSRIILMAEQLVVVAHRFLKMKYNQNKKGGYLAVINHQRPELTLVAKVGQVSKEKTHKCEVLTREQAWRLFAHIGHWTSFESRNEMADVLVYDDSHPHLPATNEPWGHWGGAVSGNRYIFSFSGFTEQLDEAMMFALAIKLGQLKKDWVVREFGNKNEMLIPFFNECNWTE